MTIKVNNWKGCVNFESDKKHLLFKGVNGAGKSSILEAISMAAKCTPLPNGVKKGEIALFLNNGAQSGNASIDGNVVSWPDCKAKGVAVSDDISLGILSLTKMSEKDFFTACKNIGADVLESDVKNNLVQLGEKKTSAIWKRVSDEGLEGAAKFYRNERAKQKGAWEYITKEKWGDEKANGWSPAGWSFEFDSMSRAEVKEKIEALEIERDGFINARNDYIREHTIWEQSKINKELSEKNALIKKTELAKLESKLSELNELQKAYVEPKKVTTCPSCGASLCIDKATLSIPDGDKTQEIRDTILRCEAITKSITEIENNGPELGDEPVFNEPDTYIKDIERLESVLSMMETKDNALKASNAVYEYDLVTKALEPNGILKEKITDALKTFNNTLLLISGIVKARVDEQGYWSGFGRPYKALSKAEKYAVCVFAQIAYTIQAKNKVLVIDGIDILFGECKPLLMKTIERCKRFIPNIYCAESNESTELQVFEL